MIVLRNSLMIAMLLGGVAIAPLLAQNESTPAGAAVPPVAAEVDQDEPSEEEAATPPRDPFGTTAPMQDAARQQRGNTIANIDGTALPEMTLRGYIEAADAEKPAIALVEIEDTGVVLVRAGDELSVRRGGTTLRLRVTAVAQMAAHIAIEPLDEKVIVR
jgi:hypothetical protein